jgi:hypothetical protein
MKLKPNKTALIVGASFLALGLVIFIVMNGNKPKTPTQKVSTFVKFDGKEKTSTQLSSGKKIDTSDPDAVAAELGLKSSSESSASDKTSSTSLQPAISNSDLVQSAMQNFVSISLDNKELDKRNEQLKQKLTDSLYGALNIESDTETLKTMWGNWENKKVLDTNQPVQLTNQNIKSLKVFQDSSDDTNFIVKTSVEIQSPASPNTSIIDREYTVQLENGKLNTITKVSEVPQKNE